MRVGEIELLKGFKICQSIAGAIRIMQSDSEFTDQPFPIPGPRLALLLLFYYLLPDAPVRNDLRRINGARNSCPCGLYYAADLVIQHRNLLSSHNPPLQYK